VTASLDQSVGIMAWSPLQFGLLSGKFRRGQTKPAESRLNSMDAPANLAWIPSSSARATSSNSAITLAAANWILSTGDVDRPDAVGAHPLFR
jgi:aryl-alcohol dehydrogenase-like predicted oxidoreductase